MHSPGSHQSAGSLFASLFLSWIIIIVLGTTLPWHTIDPHLQWWRIDWAPFHSGTLRPRVLFDVAVNVVLYLPFGYLCRQWVGQKGGWMAFVCVIGMAAGLSCCTEFVQIFNSVRFPAMVDVVMNVAGALLGAWAVVPKDHQQLSFLVVDTSLNP